MFLAVVLLLAMADSPLRLGLRALEQKDFPSAVQYLEQATKTTPRDASIWILLAQARFAAGHADAGLEAATKAEAVGGGDPDIQHGLAFLYAELAHDYPKAALFETRYAHARPTDMSAWARVASLYLKAGLPEQAIEPASRVFKQNPTPENASLLEHAYFGVAQSQLLKQDFEAALITLEEARQVLKESAQVELAIGVALYGKRKFPEAVGQFLRTMELAPDVQQPYIFVGKILEHAGERLPALLQRFTAYQQRHPDSHLGYLLAAKALALQGGNPGRTLTLARQAVDKKEDDPESQFLLGTLLEGASDFAGAATAFERSIALRGGDAPTHYRLARVYLKLGRKDEAAQHRAAYDKLSEDSATQPR